MVLNNRIDSRKIKSIPTGVDSDLFDPKLYDRDKSRLKFQLHSEDFVIGIVAVLRSSKRHDNFLKIAKQLKLEFPEKKLRFLIVGEGPMRKHIEDLIDKLSLNKDVRMLGHIENIPELMSCLDVFLFTADRNEGVPQVVMQSLLMNVKTVSSNDGSTADLFNENNFLISDPSFEALYKNTKTLINDFDKVSFLGDSRDYIADSFSQKVATKKTLNIYKKLIETDAQNI